MLRTRLQEFKDTIAGNDVYIIGGGPSLKTFDFSLLDNKITIALNTAYKSLKHPTAIYWADQDWVARHLEHVSKINCFKFTSKINCDAYITQNISSFANSIVLRKEKDYGFSIDLNNVSGNNSGAQALNLVANMKPYRIILLGYDMRFKDGHSHFHEGYEINNCTVYKELFIPSINIMAPIIQKMGIEVINCSAISELTCFKKDNIEKYL